MKKDKVYFNVVCEEICHFGGKIIHEDVNKGTLQEVYEFVVKNINKYPNALWQMYPIIIHR